VPRSSVRSPQHTLVKWSSTPHGEPNAFWICLQVSCCLGFA